MRATSSSRATSGVSGTKPIRFSIGKEHFRRIEVEPGVTVCHLYPTLGEWVGREAPDDVNPRSHGDEALSGSVPKAIEETIKEHPEDFYLANRGATILAQSVTFDPDAEVAEILLTDHQGDDATHGVADGGTTDAMIARVQAELAAQLDVSFQSLSVEQLPHCLRTARIHLEVIVGLTDRERIWRLVQGRNTSRQVKPWTIADFKGHFEWIKDILESEDSAFRGRIGYEENASADVNILEVLAILTLFHPAFDAKGKAPTVAYSSKGRMDKRLVAPDLADGYRSLRQILTQILELHDHVYAGFQEKYKEAFPGGKLGRRGKNDNRIFPVGHRRLPLSNRTVERSVPAGVLYPLLASLRALVAFPEKMDDGASWKIDPFDFFDRFGAELVGHLIEQLEVLQSNPQTMGKTKTVYTALHDRARLLVAEARA